MPRNSAFKKATKAIAKTRDFFSYESPYLAAAPPDTEACYGPCCAGFGVAASVALAAVPVGSSRPPPPAVVNQPAVVMPKRPAATSLMDKIAALQESGSDEDEVDETTSSDEGHDEEDDGDDDDDDDDSRDTVLGKAHNNGMCECRSCLAARPAGAMYPSAPREVAPGAAVKKAVDGRRRPAATTIWGLQGGERRQNARQQSQEGVRGWLDLESEIAASLDELQEQVWAETELRDVLRWAWEKIIKVTVPLGDKALQQLVTTLIASAKAGSIARLMDDRAKAKAVQRAAVPESEPTQWPPCAMQVSQQIQQLRAAMSDASVVEKSISEVLSVLRRQVPAASEHCAGERVGPEPDEQILNTITKAPMTEAEYKEVSARSLIFNGLSPNYSKADVVKLLSSYGEVETCKLVLHPRDQWVGFFTMTSSKAAQEARKHLHRKVVDGNEVMVDKPPEARLLRAIQAQIRKKRAVNATRASPKHKGQKTANPRPRLSHADKDCLTERLQRLTGKEKDDVAEIISANGPAVNGAPKYNGAVDLDELSDAVLLKLLAYFCKRFDGAPADSHPKLVHCPAISKDMLEVPAAQAESWRSRKEKYPSPGVQKGGGKTRQPAVTKWDLLRGLKCATEEFLQMKTAMANEQYGRFNDPSVLNAPNLPTGAYTILRNDILAESVGNILGRIREGQPERQCRLSSAERAPTRQTDGRGDVTQPGTIRAAGRDPLARRWNSLRRDFPDVAAMISKLQPERQQIRAWVTSGRLLSPSCFHVVAADERSADAVAQALGGNDLHGADDLAAFARRLAGIDKDARFQLEKPEPQEIAAKEARCKELLELGVKIMGRYPELVRLISLETELPYHPDHEEGQFREEC